MSVHTGISKIMYQSHCSNYNDLIPFASEVDQNITRGRKLVKEIKVGLEQKKGEMSRWKRWVQDAKLKRK